MLVKFSYKNTQYLSFCNTFYYFCAMKSRFLLFAVVPLLLVSCLGYKSSRYHKCEGAVWATSYHIVYNSPKMLDDSIIAVMSRVEMSLSPFEPMSTVSLINSGGSVVVDSLFRRVFNVSQKVCSLSGGAFDPTVAPVVNLWGFGYKSGSGDPTQAQIDSAMQGVGILKCLISDSTIVKHPATEFNFSAITKGYGCDLIGEMLQRNGCVDFMIEIGGEVVVSGKNPQGEKWHILIDAPVASDSTVVHERMAVIEVTDCGIATSGNYRNYRSVGPGKRVGHTINPLTGRPVESSMLSATVIAPDAMSADALATACMAMNPAKALSMIEALPHTEALIVVADSAAAAGWKMILTSGFPEVH